MGHADLAADGCAEAEVLGILSSADEKLMQALLTLHDGRKTAASAPKQQS